MNRADYLKLLTALGAGALLPNTLLAQLIDEELKRSDFSPLVGVPPPTKTYPSVRSLSQSQW